MREETVSLDSLFRWHLLDKYGLPWEASPFVLEMCCVMQHIDLHRDESGEESYIEESCNRVTAFGAGSSVVVAHSPRCTRVGPRYRDSE